jgi:hypothetical protein
MKIKNKLTLSSMVRKVSGLEGLPGGMGSIYLAGMFLGTHGPVIGIIIYSATLLIK